MTKRASDTSGKKQKQAHSKKHKTGETSGHGDNHHEQWRFKEELHLSRYSRLKDKKFLENRHIDWDVLKNLGLAEEVAELTSVGAWSRFFDIVEVSYRELTVEFMASFSINPRTVEWSDPDAVQFRLLGKWFQQSITQFSVNMGLYDEEFTSTESYKNLQVVMSYSPVTYWPKIGNTPLYDSATTKATALRRQSYRYIHNVLAYSISGRGDSWGSVTKSDLTYLWSMVENQPIHLGYFMLQFIRRQVDDARLSVIAIGPYVTRLAKQLRLFSRVKEPSHRRMVPVGFETLFYMKMVTRRSTPQGYRYTLIERDHPRQDPRVPTEPHPQEPDVEPQLPTENYATASQLAHVSQQVSWNNALLVSICQHLSIHVPSVHGDITHHNISAGNMTDLNDDDLETCIRQAVGGAPGDDLGADSGHGDGGNFLNPTGEDVDLELFQTSNCGVAKDTSHEDINVDNRSCENAVVGNDRLVQAAVAEDGVHSDAVLEGRTSVHEEPTEVPVTFNAGLGPDKSSSAEEETEKETLISAPDAVGEMNALSDT